MLDIAANIGCSIVGVDLAEGHINMAKQSVEQYRREKIPDLRAEFYAASYFELPEAVTKQRFSHVMMQTSLHYAHHRIDDILGNISRVLRPGGVLVVTDFNRISDLADVKRFMEMNSMSLLLSLDELKAALVRTGMEYFGGEDLYDHCIKCNSMKAVKVVEDNIQGLSVEIFKLREEFVRDRKVSFQILMAKKV